MRVVPGLACLLALSCSQPPHNTHLPTDNGEMSRRMMLGAGTPRGFGKLATYGDTFVCVRGVEVMMNADCPPGFATVRNCTDIPLDYSRGEPTPQGIEVVSPEGNVAGHLRFEAPYLNDIAGFSPRGNEPPVLSELMHFYPTP